MSWMKQLLERGRQRHGDRVAVVDGDRRITYAELDRRTDALATGLLEMGIERGHRVAVSARNRLEVIEVYFALGKIGAIAVPVHYAAVEDEVAAIVQRCGVTAIVGEDGVARKVGQRLGCVVLGCADEEYQQAVAREPALPPEDIPDDQLLFILQTSATTGRSKGVCLDQSAMRYGTLGYLSEIEWDRDDVFLHCGPLSHGAMVLPLIYLATGGTVVLMRMFTPAECVSVIRREKVTHLFLVPDMIRFILNSPGVADDPPDSLREVMYGAAPMPRSLLLEARAALGCDFRQIYALTEAGAPVAVLAPADHDYTPGEDRESGIPLGRAIMGTVISSRDESGNPCPPGEKGELWVRGPAVMRGYWNDSAATDEIMRDGWIRTGDLGRLDERGYVHLDGRLKDVIVRGGQKVFPAEVERALLGHPAVREACVVGIPSDKWGEIPFAYVVASGETAEIGTALRELARGRLARYKRPMGYEILAELPRNAIGKADRQRLRAQAPAAAEIAGPCREL